MFHFSMRSLLFSLLLVASFDTCFVFSDSTSEVTTTITNFFTGLTTRNEAMIRRCLGKQLLAIQSGEIPVTEIIEVETASMVPKNDDFDSATISNIEVSTTDHAGTAAMASYKLTVTRENGRVRSWKLFATLVKREDRWEIVTIVMPR
jgi:hypothetical protein